MQKVLVLSAVFLALPVDGAIGQESGSNSGQELSPEDKNAFPFPPGQHAALVKETCTECHGANLVTNKTFNQQSAKRYYRLMVGSDTDTPKAQKVIEYLSSELGAD